MLRESAALNVASLLYSRPRNHLRQKHDFVLYVTKPTTGQGYEILLSLSARTVVTMMNCCRPQSSKEAKSARLSLRLWNEIRQNRLANSLVRFMPSKRPPIE